MFKESSMWRTRVLHVYLNYQDSVLVTFNNQAFFFLPNDSILRLDGKVATNIDLQQAISNQETKSINSTKSSKLLSQHKTCLPSHPQLSL